MFGGGNNLSNTGFSSGGSGKQCSAAYNPRWPEPTIPILPSNRYTFDRD